ncbi:MAG: ribonuclease HII [Clostridiales bacterium]|nr:ribonuclease HII [Clostridiales bacterium]
MTLEFENELFSKGFKSVCGIDEAGRGPLAGPVCAAAVILNTNDIPEGINDSKKLTEKKREALYDKIMESAIVSYSLVDAKIIDEINIRQATILAMQNAAKGMAVKPDFLLIDGNFTIGLSKNEKFVIGGDAKSLSIGAASIIAKVTRDRLMLEIDKEYPMYNFKKHKGYGTKEHIEAIKKYGPCPYHRQSFLTKIL